MLTKLRPIKRPRRPAAIEMKDIVDLILLEPTIFFDY